MSRHQGLRAERLIVDLSINQPIFHTPLWPTCDSTSDLIEVTFGRAHKYCCHVQWAYVLCYMQDSEGSLSHGKSLGEVLRCSTISARARGDFCQG